MTGRELVKLYGERLLGTVVMDERNRPLLVTKIDTRSVAAMRGIWVEPIDRDSTINPCILYEEPCALLFLNLPHLLDRVAQARWARRQR